jgi:hypothetical protein
MRKVTWLTTAFLLAALALIFDSVQSVRWQGSYSVRVTIERAGNSQVESAAAVALFRTSWELAEGDPERIESGWKAVTVADGDCFTVKILTGGKSSGMGREISYVRQEVLVLRVNYRDGESRVVAAEIPESNSSREVTLLVP